MRFFRSGRAPAWVLVIAIALLFMGTTGLLARTAELRYERDVARMVYNGNVELLESVRREVGASTDSMQATLDAAGQPLGDRPYLVVSIADHRVWYKLGDSVLFTTEVATGTGKVMEKGGKYWRFETPRGRMVVQSKETNPTWVPPDWHYIEQARKRGLGIVQLQRGQSLTAPDGSTITVAGSEVVRRAPGQPDAAYAPGGSGAEIVVGGNIVIPPFGTNQRRYADVLGTHRLNLGDGYALHGTNQPESIGRSVSHGCIRLRNSDIEILHGMVAVGTPVFIY